MPLGTEMMADFLVSGKILSSFLVDNNNNNLFYNINLFLSIFCSYFKL